MSLGIRQRVGVMARTVCDKNCSRMRREMPAHLAT
ncbi:hypothetical protein NB311A_14025 [Nitrobacter sp. Nb-311A]|nr:hypothetical protein NB311A_14025 [Nitrobacter sp. Nb-311A]